jgi:hypothetical protein
MCWYPILTNHHFAPGFDCLCTLFLTCYYATLRCHATVKCVMYGVQSIPSGLVRRLATRKFVLGDEEGNEDEQEETKALAGPGHESGSQRHQVSVNSFLLLLARLRIRPNMYHTGLMFIVCKLNSEST